MDDEYTRIETVPFEVDEDNDGHHDGDAEHQQPPQDGVPDRHLVHHQRRDGDDGRQEEHGDLREEEDEKEDDDVETEGRRGLEHPERTKPTRLVEALEGLGGVEDVGEIGEEPPRPRSLCFRSQDTGPGPLPDDGVEEVDAQVPHEEVEKAVAGDKEVEEVVYEGGARRRRAVLAREFRRRQTVVPEHLYGAGGAVVLPARWEAAAHHVHRLFSPVATGEGGRVHFDAAAAAAPP